MRVLFIFCASVFGPWLGHTTNDQTCHAADHSQSLGQFVAEFNNQQDKAAIHLHGPALTKDEVIAALRASLRNLASTQSKETVAIVRRILDSQQLPDKALLEIATFSDPGGEFVFDIYDISLRLPTTADGQVGLPIRKRFIASRTLNEEIHRLERQLKLAPELPGKYRLADRLRELRSRASATDAPNQ